MLQGMVLSLKYVTKEMISTKQRLIICIGIIASMILGGMTIVSYSINKAIIIVVHPNVNKKVMNFLFWLPLCTIEW
jgi:hypothetical protein